jgi:hypothetical protein
MSPVSSGRVLVLLVLGLERADADAVLLDRIRRRTLHVLDDLTPVARVLGEQLAEDQPASRVQIASMCTCGLPAAFMPRSVSAPVAPLRRNQAQRLLVHRALEGRLPAVTRVSFSGSVHS